ncbi:MAG: hypothetical protein SNH35_03265 [Rikenellaceae bacterium]
MSADPITTKNINRNHNLKVGVYVVDDDFLLRFKSEKVSSLYAKAKAAVLNMALEKAGCDMILTPIYKLEVKYKEKSNNHGASYRSYYNNELTYTISVKGFGANIKGVRQIKTN